MEENIQMKGELQAIMNTLEGTTYANLQSIDQLLDYGFTMIGWIARTGEIMAEAKEQLHHSRKKAYLSVIASLGSHEKKMGPMLIKDYVNDCCAQENALYELAERCNRACTHSNDFIRTAVSALKAEKFSSQFSESA